MSAKGRSTDRENSGKEPSLIREPAEPFVVVGNKEDGFVVTLGQHKMTRVFKTQKEAELAVERRDYEILLNMTYVMALRAHEFIGDAKAGTVTVEEGGEMVNL